MNAVDRCHQFLDVATTGAATGATGMTRAGEATGVTVAAIGAVIAAAMGSPPAAATTGAATGATGMTRAGEAAGATVVMIAVDLPVAIASILTATIWLVPEAQIECDSMVTGKRQPHHHHHSPPKINGKWGRHPRGGRYPKMPNGGVVADKCVGATEATFVALSGAVPVVTPVVTSTVVFEGGTSHLALLTRTSLASNAADAAMIISTCVPRSINFAAGADVRVIFFVFVALRGHLCPQIDGQNLVQ